MAFVGSLLSYIGLLIIMLIAAGLGIFAGKKMRDRKDAKTAAENSDAKINE